MKSFFAIALLAFVASAEDAVKLEDVTCDMVKEEMKAEDKGVAWATTYDKTLAEMQTQCKANDKRIATETATKADADLKKAEVDKKKTGVTLGDLKNVYDVIDFEVKTGAADAEVKRGDMSIKSAWDKGTGVDALTTYMLWWKLTPTADYEFGKSRIQLVTAECEWCTGFEVSQFTSRLSGDGQTTQQIYNYNSFDTSVYGTQSNRIGSSQ